MQNINQNYEISQNLKNYMLIEKGICCNDLMEFHTLVFMDVLNNSKVTKVFKRVQCEDNQYGYVPCNLDEVGDDDVKMYDDEIYNAICGASLVEGTEIITVEELQEEIDATYYTDIGYGYCIILGRK